MIPVCEDKVKEGKIAFVVLGRSGDDRLFWDASDPEQVKEAMGEFDRLMKEGYSAFLVNADGSPGEMIASADWSRREVRENEEILFRKLHKKPQEVTMVPPLVRG